MRPATQPELIELCEIVEAKVGLTISRAKRTLVGVRLVPRLRALRLPSFDAYCRLLQASDAELLHVVDVVTTHETSFMRQPHHFAFIEENLLPRWRAEAQQGKRPHQARAWSAGCSTGEEPHSIAMVLRDGLPVGEGWNVQVLATDISEGVIRRAKAARFPIAKAWQLPAKFREAYTHSDVRADELMFEVEAEITRLLRFERINLLDELYPVGREYDFIFCRNVLIYMKPEKRMPVVERLLDHLTDGGHLFLGHAEGCIGLSRVRRVGPTIYERERR